MAEGALLCPSSSSSLLLFPACTIAHVASNAKTKLDRALEADNTTAQRHMAKILNNTRVRMTMRTTDAHAPTVQTPDSWFPLTCRVKKL